MSTRCTIHFVDGQYGGHSEAIIYRHSDGYPECVLPDLEEFFKAVKAQTDGDTRFNDPSYLAAKYVVWLAGQFARTITLVDDEYVEVSTPPLAFLSVGVVTSDPNDIEHRYIVQCRGASTPDVLHEALD